MAKRGNWYKFIVGSKHGDDLKGSAGKDIVVGRQGDDSIQGGAGNDILFGDDIFGGTLWGCRFGGWWHASGSGNDYLDGGAGSDRVIAGRGNDFANYTLSQNLRSHDLYDGGKGLDTLQLTLTHSEFLNASVQQDIAAFQRFLEYKANPFSDHGKTFHFKSFDLDARNFEALKINVIDAAPANAAPTARDDVAATNESTPLVITAPGLLANDTDPDQHDVLTVKGADALSALGAAISRDAGGNLTYDPTGALALQQLAEGATTTDSFSYTISDLAGATASAAVQVTLTGVNDRPVAFADSNAKDEDHAVAGNVLANDDDIDVGDTLAVAAVNGSAANVGAPIVLGSGARLTVNKDGSYTYDPAGQFEYLGVGESITDSFDYTIADLGGATASATTRITVTGVNDAPVAADDIMAPVSAASVVEERLITFNDQGNPPTDVDGYAFAGFTVFGFGGVGGTSMAAAGTGNNNVGGGFDADGAVKRADGQDFAVHSLSIAALSYEPTVKIMGYNDGKLVEGAEVTQGLAGGYATIEFGAAWESVDEVRFYGTVAEPEGDYVMIDNLLVSSGGGASGHSEDVPLDIDVLANDTDVDSSDVLHVSGFTATSTMGAAISLNPDGTLHYDPTDADDIQMLARGETATDTFEYTASDDNGGTSIATVSVELLGADEPDPSLTASLGAPDVDLL
jgi:VCBS repeat-containing protein